MRVEQRKSLEEQPWSRRLVLGERSRIVPPSALLLSGSSHEYGDRYSDSREHGEHGERGERGERGEGKSFFPSLGSSGINELRSTIHTKCCRRLQAITG